MTVQLSLIYGAILSWCCFHPLMAAKTPPSDMDNPLTLSQEESLTKKLADQCFKEQEYLPALNYYLDALEGEVEKDDLLMRSKIFFDIGMCYRRLNEYEQALDYFNRCLDFPSGVVSSERMAKIFGYLGSVYQALGYTEKAYEFQIKALETKESLKDSAGICQSFYELGTLFYYQKNYTEALSYYEKSKTLSQQLGKKRALFSALGGIGCAYGALENFDTAQHYNFRALRLAQELGLKSGQAYALQNIGVNYLSDSSFDKAAENLERSLRLNEELGDKWGQICTYNLLGKLGLKMGQVSEAISKLEQGLLLSEEIKSKTLKVELLRTLIDVYHEVGEFKQSHAFFEDYIDLKDSLMNEKLAKELGIEKMKYDVKKRENEIILLKERQKSRQLHFNFILTGGGFLLLFIVSLFLWGRFRLERKFNKELAEKSDEIYNQNIILERVNDDLKKFAYIVAHDLKAPLRTIGSFTSLINREYKSFFDDRGNKYMSFILEAVKRMDQLMNGLLTYCQIEYNLHSSRNMDTVDAVKTALLNLQNYIDQKKAIIKVNDDTLPNIKGNPTHMTLLFQNIIANGIKFQNRDIPLITVDCQSHPKKHIFSIRDNGIGIKREFHQKIFEMFTRLHTEEEYDGTGIGLATCKKIVERSGGEIWVESEPGQGSTFYFTLPKN